MAASSLSMVEETVTKQDGHIIGDGGASAAEVRPEHESPGSSIDAVEILNEEELPETTSGSEEDAEGL